MALLSTPVLSVWVELGGSPRGPWVSCTLTTNPLDSGVRLPCRRG